MNNVYSKMKYQLSNRSRPYFIRLSADVHKNTIYYLNMAVA